MQVGLELQSTKMYVLTSETKLNKLFFRKQQGISSANEPLAFQSSDESMDDTATKPVHTKSVESKPNKSKPKQLELTKNRKELLNKNKIKNKKRTRRGYGTKNRKNKLIKINQNLTIVGTNSAGLTSKKESFFNLVNSLNPSIITI